MIAWMLRPASYRDLAVIVIVCPIAGIGLGWYAAESVAMGAIVLYVVWTMIVLPILCFRW